MSNCLSHITFVAERALSSHRRWLAGCLLLAGLIGTAGAQVELLPAGGIEIAAASGGVEHSTSPAIGLPASLSGVIHDLSAAAIPGAVVTLSQADQTVTKRAESDIDGAFVVPGIEPGTYRVTVSMPGFETWTGTTNVEEGQNLAMAEIALAISPVATAVEVRASTEEVAEAQLHFQEKQRVLGVFPNFYASYLWAAEPLSSRQKFQLAWRFSGDPVAFGMAGVVAGAEQANHSFAGYGPGVAGYAKRFGASYTDGLTSTMFGQAIFPAVFHQDPRYFVKGTGTVASRALYAIATTVICRGDDRRWQLNYSNILGNVVSASLSNVYYPASDRHGASLTIQNSLVTTALGAVGGLIQEFMLHRMTPNLPDYSSVQGQ